MKVLHILKSKPDETVNKLFDIISRDVALSVVELYEEGIDWHVLVDEIFEHDRVICWW